MSMARINSNNGVLVGVGVMVRRSVGCESKSEIRNRKREMGTSLNNYGEWLLLPA
jgi:hypothetical protein